MDDLIQRIRLIRTSRIGPIAYRQLLMRFGSAGAALDALPDLAKRGGGKAPKPCLEGVAVGERKRVDALGGRYVGLGEADYPALLAEMDDAPPLLTVRGDITLFERAAVAMVGARNASAAGCRFARELAGELGKHGRAVVSGLARGIDSAAHDGAMESGTIGVIAGGLDVVYPRGNEGRQEAVAERGLLVAEMPPGTEPHARHFPNRNRIIAGLAAGTVVVETAPRSGSLITARLAGELGREVMAVPGHPLDPRAAGCNGLIRDGAVLVRGADDVIDCLAPLDDRAVPAVREESPVAYAQEPDERASEVVTGLLGPVAVTIDELVRQSGASSAEVQLVLLELDLAGRLERHAGSKVSLIPA